jgi:hypothetical protein
MYAGRFDARTLSAAQAGEVVRLCAQVEASAAAVKVLAAARIAESRAWQANGYRSAAEQLADQAGIGSGSAKRALETGQRMADQAEVARAALAGDLSLEQAAAVSDGVAADPSKAAELIERAKESSLSELNEAVAKVKADNTDLEKRRRDRHARRSLRKWTDRDGALNGRLFGHPEDGVLLWRALDPVRRRLNALRRQAGKPNDTFEALDYDALIAIAAAAVGKYGELSLVDLVELGLFPDIQSVLAAAAGPGGPGCQPDLFGAPDAPRPSGGDPPPEPVPLPADNAKRAKHPKKMAGSPGKVMIRVDLGVLLRGYPLEGELCEIAGYGPVPVSVIEDLIATDNPFIVGILTNSEQLTGVYHHGRHPNAHQRSALDFLYPTCAAKGCPARAGLQYDHRQDWATTKITAFDLLDRLCPHHHAQKTRHNWALVDGRGKRPFVPPEDPRHPRHRGGRPGPSP